MIQLSMNQIGRSQVPGGLGRRAACNPMNEPSISLIGRYRILSELGRGARFRIAP